MDAAPRDRTVVLVHSPPHGEVDFLHVGLAYLQAVLEQAGFETVFHDISFAEHRAGTDFYDAYVLELSRRIGGDVGDGVDPRLLMEVLHPDELPEISGIAKRILSKVEAHLPVVAGSGDVFLFTVNVLTQYFAAALASRLRAAGKITIAGGPNLGFAPLRSLLLRSGAFDAVVDGPGESVIVPLVESLGRGGDLAIPGVSVLDDRGEILVTPIGAAPHPDSLPYPSLHGMTLTYFVPILASRGCAMRCAYCSETTKTPRYLQRDADVVVREMEWAAAEYGDRNFHFHDDQINSSAVWADRFCSSLAEAGWGFTWESFCGPDGLTPERLDLMRRSGCVLLKLGVQSFSGRVLGLMKRNDRVRAVTDAIVHGARIGISMRFDMLTCFPGETDDDHRQNLEAIEGIYAATRDVHFSPNPFYLSLGSETHLEHGSFGINLKAFDPDSLPPRLASLVRTSGAFPVGFKYGIDQETVRRRLDDYGAILKRQDKDYLYLGQRGLPERSAEATKPAPSRPVRRRQGSDR